MKVIYKEVVNLELSDHALDIIKAIDDKSDRHQLKEYFNDTLDVYYNDDESILYVVKTKETDTGIELTVSKTFV